jgi:hypothetical protein
VVITPAERLAGAAMQQPDGGARDLKLIDPETGFDAMTLCLGVVEIDPGAIRRGIVTAARRSPTSCAGRANWSLTGGVIRSRPAVAGAHPRFQHRLEAPVEQFVPELPMERLEQSEGQVGLAAGPDIPPDGGLAACVSPATRRIRRARAVAPG